jgi:hypothetical protein
VGRGRSFVTAVLAAWLVLLPGFVGSDAGAAQSAATDVCSTFEDNDPRLGPDEMPKTSPVGFMVLLYDRYGGLSKQEFLARYWDAGANDGRGAWRYPPNDGFLLDFQGKPIFSEVTLYPGMDLDRFGSEFGAFLAPASELYTQRALPPQNLNTFDPAYPCNYHLYRVMKPFKVRFGPIAPWFNQLGFGFQEKLEASLVPGAPSPLNVMWLVNNGYLKRLN